MESLVLAGAFDFYEELERSTYFAPSGKYDTYMEHLLKYGAAYQNQKSQAANSLFGASEEALIPKPKLPEGGRQWSLVEKLTKEKEVAGIFISGHPLDDYLLEAQLASCALDKIDSFRGREVKLAVIVIGAQHRISRKGTGWGLFIIQDFNTCLLYTSPSPRDRTRTRMPSSA